jgi:oligopeptide transport system permease protein
MATAPTLDEGFLSAERYEVGEQVGLWRDSWRRLRRNKLAIVSLGYIVILAAVAILSHFWTPYQVWQEGLGSTFAGPSAAHPLGLDDLGRDLLSRVMGGVLIALAVGVGAALLSSLIGVALGLVAGFYRGALDTGISLLINVWYGIPDLLIVIMFVVITGRRELLFIIVAIALTAWLNMARLVRGQTFSLREREFVEAARSIGTRDGAIIVRHILPNAMGPIIVQATYLIPQAIIFEAFLSFLGQGVPPPTPSWGAMAAEGYQALQFAPHIVLVPALALATTLLAFNFLGDGLRDALDPRMRR